MSEFLDKLCMDTCKLEERHYSFGLYTDLCGMSVKDAKDAASACCCGKGGGDESGKTENTIIFTLEPVESEYEILLTFTEAPSKEVDISFKFNGESNTVVVPAGNTSFYTGVKSASKYGVLSNVTVSSLDEKYTYSYVDEIEQGVFLLTYILDGEVYSSVYVEFGATVTTEATPQKYVVGYDFAWTDEKTGAKIGDSFTMPEMDLNIIGVATVLQYTLTYMDGETKIGEQTYNYNAVITPISAPAKEGYEFKYWDGIPSRMPANNVTVNAVYEEITELSVFFSLYLNASASTLNESIIKGFQSYDGKTSKEYDIPVTATTIPADEKVISLSQQIMEADDEGDEERAEELIQELNDYRVANKMCFIAAINPNLAFDKLNSGFGDLDTTELAPISIDGSEYKIYKYISPEKFGMTPSEEAQPFRFIIKLK